MHELASRMANDTIYMDLEQSTSVTKMLMSCCDRSRKGLSLKNSENDKFTNSSFTAGREVMSLNSVEHRTASRFPMQLPVELLFDDGGKVSVVTRNVSASGVYLEVDRELQLKSRLRFLITFPKEITTSCRIVTLCDGIIVRKETAGNREGLAVKIERYEFLGSKP